MTETSPRRIAILEDSPAVRDHFTDIIESAPDLSLCAVAACMAETPAILAAAPDLVLTDIGLPDGSGLDFIPAIKKAGFLSLVITAFADRETVVTALAAGADGYLLKDSAAGVILDGVRVTLDGGAPISAAAAVFLLEKLRTPQLRTETVSERLTQRETELLRLFARGMSYKAAAREMGVSPLTVGNHVKAIYRKLEVNSRGEAVFAAVANGDLRLE